MKKRITYSSENIFYQVEGSGNPVILIHGFGEKGTVWKNQVAHLKHKFQLIVPDLPGSGESEPIPDMSIEGMAEVIHAIIHAENIECCPVIGHSMGGYITLALAEKYWNHVLAFGLFHSTSFADSPEKKILRSKSIEFIKQHGPFEFLKTTIPNLFSPKTKEENPQLIEGHISGIQSFSSNTLISYYEAMQQRPDRSALMRNTAVPVLFILGKYDIAVPVEESLKQCHLPEKSYIHMLRESGHMGMLEEPQMACRIVEEFLQDCNCL